MADLRKMDIVCADDDAFGWGTFQSHNQKVVYNRNGIFMTHIRDRNEDYTAQTWRLSWSPDGGRTFASIYEATDATNPPVLETDGRDDIYLVRPDFVDRNAYLYRFSAEDGYTRPEISKIERGSAGKFCMFHDREREQLYYFAHNNTFHVVGLDGSVRLSYTLLQAGETAILQYPHLSLGEDGVLHAAWTTEKIGEYLYTDIHYMRSRDGGSTWEKMDGTPLGLPVVADFHGPTDQISLDDEYDYHTWLSSFMAKDGKLHFVYRYAAPGDARRQHYVRYDIESGRREVDIWPEFRGNEISLSNPDGFFASRTMLPGSPLYCVLARDGRIACLASDDNGDSWYDYAISDREFADDEELTNPYAIGGCRQITPEGCIIGSFTDRIPDPDQVIRRIGPGATAPVYFFKIHPFPGEAGPR